HGFRRYQLSVSQRMGFRSGNGTLEVLASNACRVAASSLGGGGPVSLLARALSTGSGRVSALAGTGGSKPPAVRTVPHSLGSLLIVSEDLRRVPVAGGPAPAIAAFLSIAYHLVRSSPQPSSPRRGF